LVPVRDHPKASDREESLPRIAMVADWLGVPKGQNPSGPGRYQRGRDRARHYASRSMMVGARAAAADEVIERG
jgi:hypothetical protein